MKRTMVWVLALGLTATIAAGSHAQNPCNPCGGKKSNPCNPCGGKKASMKMPAVNPCHAKMGMVFYINDPMGRDTITFTSEAPLEDIIGTSNKVMGYVVFDPTKPEKGLRGKVVVPAASLTTGIPLRDEHLRQPAWLNAEANPEIMFEINEVKNAKEIKKTGAFTTWELSAKGPITINGTSKTVEIPVRLTYLAESETTKSKMPGNLLAARADFHVALADFGIKGFEGIVGSKVGETIAISASIMGTNAEMTAKNPCNPCGGKKQASK